MPVKRHSLVETLRHKSIVGGRSDCRTVGRGAVVSSEWCVLYRGTGVYVSSNGHMELPHLHSSCTRRPRGSLEASAHLSILHACRHHNPKPIPERQFIAAVRETKPSWIIPISGDASRNLFIAPSTRSRTARTASRGRRRRAADEAGALPEMRARLAPQGAKQGSREQCRGLYARWRGRCVPRDACVFYVGR